MLSLQDMFDAAYNGVVSQGKPSMYENNYVCRYRGEGGTKCAVGWLIPDDKYETRLEGWSPEHLCAYKYIDAELLPLGFLTSMRKCHDDAAVKSLDKSGRIPIVDNAVFLNLYKSKMRDFAVKYNLSVPT